MPDHAHLFARAQRLVLKLGSSSITHPIHGLDLDVLGAWAQQIATLQASGKQVVVVSSGAIATGLSKLGLSQRPREMPLLQAAAAIGQIGLAHGFEQAFARHGVISAQLLLTHEDLANRQRYLNAQATFLKLLELGVVPVVNENDSVTTDEIRLGDNDTLAALVTNLLKADLLVLLTDQAGLYSADPRQEAGAELIAEASAGDRHLLKLASGAGTGIGTGGMVTKLKAAERAARSGASTLIASAADPAILSRWAAGENIGTLLKAKASPHNAKKRWLLDHLQAKGSVWLDAGASRAVQHMGKSLLAVGVTQVEGRFKRGELINCLNPEGRLIARGLSHYSHSETLRLLGKSSEQFEQLLGYPVDAELIHRDHLVLMAETS